MPTNIPTTGDYVAIAMLVITLVWAAYELGHKHGRRWAENQWSPLYDRLVANYRRSMGERAVEIVEDVKRILDEG